MIDDAELSRQLTESLRTHAQRITLREEGFDPGRRGLSLLSPTRRGRRPRTLLAAVAAVTGLALVGAILALQREPAGDSAMTSSPLDAPVPPADGAPIVSTAPEGLDLWGVSWWTQPPGTRYPTSWAQLFGDPDDPSVALLVESQPAQPGEQTGETSLTVRGHEATVLPAKDRPDDAWTLNWEEAGSALSASFRGLTQEEALAALDGLRWRSDDGATGFDAPASGTLTLLDEVLAPVAPPTTAIFTYAEGLPAGDGPAGRQLEVHTSPATGTTTLAYLSTWFNGSLDTSDRAISYDAESGSLRVVQPDGLDVIADPAGTAVPRDVVEQVVASVTPGTAAELASLWTEANERVAALPLVTEIALPSGTLELRGESRALCLRLDEGRLCQGLDDRPVATAVEGEIVGSFQAGETWYVAAAATAEAPTVEPGGPTVETGSAGTWQAVLVRPEAGIDQVDVWFGDQGVGLHRP